MKTECVASLATLKEGAEALVVDFELEGLLRRRILDLGIVPGTKLTCIGTAPAGDPVAYLVRGTVIALRKEDANLIKVDSLASNNIFRSDLKWS